MSDVGTGITVGFGTSGFTGEIMGVNGNSISRPAIDDTHMGTTNYRTFIPGKLVDGGELEVEIAFDPDAQPPISAVAETITVTFPLPAGGLTPATLVFSGFVTAWSWAGPLEEKMTASMTVKVDGKTDPVWTAST